MSQTAIYEPIDVSSSPQSVSWTIDRIGDRSILDESNWNESMINNSRYLQDYVIEYNPINLNSIFEEIQVDTSIINTYVETHVEVCVDETIEFSDEQRDCCICMEQKGGHDICRLNCHHTFCVSCCSINLSRQIRRQETPTCSLCRAEVTLVHVQNVENLDKFLL